jgi:type II secretory pathway pseudopilin PulG
MRTLLIVVAILAAAALPAVAIAAHAPSRSEKQQLRAAVKGSKLVQRSVRRGHFELVKPRISDSGKWAKAGVAPTNTYSDPFNAPKGLFKHGHGGWKLVKIGTTGIGCFKPKLSRSVRKELKLSCG